MDTWIENVLNRCNENAERFGRGGDIARDEWSRVVRVTKRSHSENRGGVRYLYSDIDAVLDDGTTRSITQVGPYKYLCRRGEVSQKEKELNRNARDAEAKDWQQRFTEFFKSQKSPATVV